jgi:hypothetical protein
MKFNNLRSPEEKKKYKLIIASIYFAHTVYQTLCSLFHILNIFKVDTNTIHIIGGEAGSEIG